VPHCRSKRYVTNVTQGDVETADVFQRKKKAPRKPGRLVSWSWPKP
jgi:hypothetical protein